MSRFFKIVFKLVAVVVALLALTAAFVYWKSNTLLKRKFTVAVSTPVLPTDAAAIERGHHLAKTRGCLECHGADLGGAKVIDDGAMGRLYGPNITRGQGGLKSGYRDEDYVIALRHGVGADGRGLFLMPSVDFAHFTDADIGDLIAYLKAAPPVDRATVPLALGPVARALFVAGKIKVSADVIDHANVHPSEVKPAVTLEYGKYVAATCTGCHGDNFSGGKIAIGPPDWPKAANLTPHASGHLANWTEADFLKTIRTCQRPDGTTLDPVMPRIFGQMNDTELKAIWVYLKSLPPLPTGTRQS
jgi:mono/diheme cytochrome c family protein